MDAEKFCRQFQSEFLPKATTLWNSSSYVPDWLIIRNNVVDRDAVVEACLFVETEDVLNRARGNLLLNIIVGPAVSYDLKSPMSAVYCPKKFMDAFASEAEALR
jgi:cellobiose phosphorylase